MEDDLLVNGLVDSNARSSIESSLNFFFQLKPEQSGGISIVWGNYNKCQNGYKVERRSYPFFVLEYIISGSGGFRVESKEWQLAPGMIFGFGPHANHSYWADSDVSLEKIAIVFTCSDCCELMSDIRFITNRANFVFNQKHIHELFSGILEEGINKSMFSKEIINHLLSALILLIRKNIIIGRSYTQSYNSYIRCKKYIEENISQKVKVMDIARACNIEKSYMSRLFRKYMNCTPNHFIKTIIVERSIEMLNQEDYSIKEIALSLGFSNPYHFSTFIKKSIGISPSRFREPKTKQGNLRSV